MSDPDLDTVLGWRGRAVRDRDGEKLGRVGDLYLDGATDRPAFAGIRTGLFGRHESIVPLDGAREQDDELILPFAAAHVRDAPRLDPDEALSEEEEDALLEHYGGGPSTAGAEGRRDATGVRPGEVAGEPPEDAGGDAPAPAQAGAQDAMTRSEEELVTGATPMRPTERVRLKKVRVTDHVTRTVPVRREEIRLETDPPPEGTIESVEDAP
jgi:hypothetical protein